MGLGRKAVHGLGVGVMALWAVACAEESATQVAGGPDTSPLITGDGGSGADLPPAQDTRTREDLPPNTTMDVEEDSVPEACVDDGSCDDEVCVEEGVEGRSVTDIQCVANQCTSTPRTETRPCFQNTDGRPCSVSGTCVNGACGEPRWVTIETGGNATSAARFSALCTVTGQSCVVEGNRPRGETLCTIACPTGATVELCCSNGSDPCGGTFAANNPDRWIDDFEVTGFVGPCMAGSGSEAPGIQCAVVVSSGPARAECDFTD